MVALSIMLEGQNGLNWKHWKYLVQEVEDLGFAGLFRSDHFTNPAPPDIDSLEMIVSQTYLADHTQRIHFGPLVAPLSFRDPLLLARQAAAIDDLSGGRMLLGIGAGWQEREHELFGYPLGDVTTRMARFEEGLEVITRLLKSDEPVHFAGRFYQLRGATLLPRPQRPGGPRILIGGNGKKRTLPLVARYAHIWNAVAISSEEFRERSVLLDTLLQQEGRRPGDVKRTLMLNLTYGRTLDEIAQRLKPHLARPELAGRSLQEAIEVLNASGKTLVGTPEHILRQIDAYAQAGVEELMLQWLDLDDHAGLHHLAEHVLAKLK
ncbi:TIGR03560 family F420-dependent LLM class oxidoreductase [Ktedonobacter racemifer]|uniref:Putative F420-dependent oxidoreductase n=1 Tax=Ktedonobacter racemifer DSM 44963 TaxID=485913 RepID=D6TP20_KTERA|nr:TIGR03560 family F420-dependent LLM class oxidoreductase [Ktedonobacter racemifer]EFH85556.1 putative F420-dependent oxidoreductase [Ktedonobacter racemifer DSM 44963]